MSSKQHHYVYIHSDPRTDEVLYVGHGFKGRAWVYGSPKSDSRSNEHLAHLEGMTESYLTPEDWVTVLYKGLTKVDACELERREIVKLKPRYNKPQGLKLLKMVDEKIQKARDLRYEGMSYKSVGEALGVSTMTIHRALNGGTKNVGYVQ